ncbi:hypothetical protein BLA9940_05198 [Burkholderia aenigmatica]|uniref:Uncharacterized protein n=1 Tax=Burkholderia aenigmatica TaxID=2015348 RepID=A0A6J5JJK1_9BURK|nr:hypothetical protein BLA3211_06452 [Burkholderia aenigmatica]VWC86993.1 hypothetical protein BLA9940_05198 [Burkholderia aenigmatica]VWD20971.1 hypothetical protein BLA17378_06603 [Burkholderia aenigmatica]VWD57872.1 hypothetical protein BLA18628_06831 [Burkholderia aenigmatica]
MSNRKHEVLAPQHSQPIFVDPYPQVVLADVPVK